MKLSLPKEKLKKNYKKPKKFPKKSQELDL